MTVVLDLGTHSFKFGQARLAQPLLLPQHILAQSCTPFGTPRRIMDGANDGFDEQRLAVRDSQVVDFDQMERLLNIVSIATGSKLDSKLSDYLQDLTKQTIAAGRCGTQVADVERMPRSVIDQLDDDSQPMNQLFIAMLHQPE